MEKYGADVMTCISYCSKGGYIGDFQRVSAAPMECRSMCQHPENLANWERKGGCRRRNAGFQVRTCSASAHTCGSICRSSQNLYQKRKRKDA